METYQVLSLVIGFLSMVGTLAAGWGAIWAVMQIRRHWRDDEPKLSCTYLYEGLSLGNANAQVWAAKIRVVNVGKVPVSVCGFVYVGDEVARRRAELDLDESIDPLRIMPAEAVDVFARAENLHPERRPVHINTVYVRTADGLTWPTVRLTGHRIDMFGHDEPYV